MRNVTISPGIITQKIATDLFVSHKLSSQISARIAYMIILLQLHKQVVVHATINVHSFAIVLEVSFVVEN